MLSKLSYLNSNIALTLGYLNPALNNSAQFSFSRCFIIFIFLILNKYVMLCYVMLTTQLISRGYCVYPQTTRLFYEQYKERLKKLNLSRVPNITAYTYDAVWTVAASLNKSIPVLKSMGLKLQDFHRNKTEMTKLFVQTIQDIHFLGVTVSWKFFVLLYLLFVKSQLRRNSST